MGYYIYKYVQNNKIIYIGQTTDLERRIKEHTKDKLKGFKGQIYYFECSNKTSMDSWEYMLINKYHPQYNSALNNSKEKINIKEPEWTLFLIKSDEKKPEYKSNIIDITSFIKKESNQKDTIQFDRQSFSPRNDRIIRFKCRHCGEVFETSYWSKTKKGYSAYCPSCPYSVWSAR